MMTAIADKMTSTKQAYALGTHKSHMSQLRAYVKFCLVFGHEPVTQTGVTTMILVHYVMWLAASGLKTLRGYVSMGPRVLCESHDAPWETISHRPRLRRMLQSLERMFGVPPKQKHPIRISQLTKVMHHLRHDNTLADQTFKVATLIGFFAFLRKANYTVESPDKFDPDVDLTIGSIIRKNGRYGIKLKRTKTVQFGQRRVVIWLPKMKNKIICPTAAISRLLRKRRGEPNSAPLLVTDDRLTPMSKTWFARRFSKVFTACGIPSRRVSPHSLRRGGATFALEQGVDPTCIKLQGDWASDAWFLYVTFTDKLKRRTLRKMEQYSPRHV